MRDMRAMQLVSLPWRWQGPVEERDPEGNLWYELRIVELPDFFVAAPSKDEVIAEAGEALEAYLASFLTTGDPMPLPEALRGAGEVPDMYKVGLEVRDLHAA